MRTLLRTLVLGTSIVGCTVTYALPERDASVHPDTPTPDGGVDADVCSSDRDGDGLADVVEGMGDADDDGIANWDDLDSDGDGVADADERGVGSSCTAFDCDGEGTPDFLSDDSDRDGLLDGEEVMHGSDRCDIDTDGDGVTDFAEVVGSHTDPTRPSSTIAPGDFFVVLPYEDPSLHRLLRFGSSVRVADVYLLVDTTGSMGVTLENLRTSLRADLLPALRTRIPDLSVGVGAFDDFPFLTEDTEHPLLASTGYGYPGDDAYAHLQDITADVDLVQAGLNRLALGNGWDWPESQLEALYQTVTGEGGFWEYTAPADGVRRVVYERSWELPARRCPEIPDELEPRRGYPCFRPNALPIVVLASDADWGAGRGDILPAPHGMDAVATAFNALGARFVSIDIDSGRGAGRGSAQSIDLARRTGSVDTSGRPLVFASAYGEVSRTVVDGIETLTTAVPQDVSTTLSDLQPNPDDVDATEFVRAITTAEGYRDGVAGTGYDHRDESTFFGVVPGTTVEFDVELQNLIRMHQARPEIFRARITVVGGGRAELDRRTLYILVPGVDGAPILF